MFFLYRMRRRPKKNFRVKMNHILFSAEGKCDVDTLHEFQAEGFVPLSVGKISGRSFLYGLLKDENGESTNMMSQVAKDSELIKMSESFVKYCGGTNPDIQMCFIPEGESERDPSWCFGVIKTVVLCRKKLGKKIRTRKLKDGYVKNISK